MAGSMKATCSVEGCERAGRIIRGMCFMHYQRLSRLGPLPPIVAVTQCTVHGCGRGGKMRRGMCSIHYDRMQEHGSTELPAVASVADRLAAGLVRMPNGCLEWSLGTSEAGYGQISVNGKHVSTHRLAWELVNGPIPDGAHIRHYVCDNPPCCDPEHLRPGTAADNMADMIAKGRSRSGVANAAKTRCPAGHEYTEANTYVTAKTGRRSCRQCKSDWYQRAKRSVPSVEAP